jgi:hypothetical protein
MRQFLVEQSQPFGLVSNTPMHPGNPSETGFSAKSTGMPDVVLNHGFNHAPSFANPGANGQAIANRNQGNPFAFVGKNF